jgi:glycosyltransferase involved in cell wall biosynthesis
MPKCCLHVTEHLDPRFGGVASVLASLSAAIAQTGSWQVILAGFCERDERVVPDLFQGVQLERFPRGRLPWLLGGPVTSRMSNLIQSADIVHIHGLWREPSSVVARLVASAGKPYVISAHGMLEHWALNHKRLRKRFYGAFVEKPTLKRARCLHALTAAELLDYRRYGLSAPVAVIPNGVTVPSETDPEIFLRQYPQLRGRRLLLYLGRIHPKKGVDLLCRAWAQVAPSLPDAHLVLAGPDSDGTLEVIRGLVVKFGIQSQVTITGMLSGTSKWSALAAADVFVLPSHSEGFSAAVLEALGVGLPVIITRQCNFPEVAASGCGWVIEPDVAELSGAIGLCLRTPAAELALFGRRGQELARSKFNWQTIAQAMLTVYQWVLGGPKPATVHLPSQDPPSHG